MCVAPIVLCARANSPSPCRKLRQFGPANVEKDALVRRPFDRRLRQPRMETLRSNGNMTRVAKLSGRLAAQQETFARR